MMAPYAALLVEPHTCKAVRSYTTLGRLRQLHYPLCFLKRADGTCMFADHHVLLPASLYTLMRPHDAAGTWGHWCPNVSVADVMERS